jgi:poly(beta-D-mannuronate) lyase
VYMYKSRAYQFRIEARSESGSYQTIVNQESNTQGGPFIDTFAPVTARYVKITVTGDHNVSTDWANINELKIMGTTSAPPSGPVNLALQSTVSSSSSQQSGNEAVKIKDDDTTDNQRWSASSSSYPQYVELDLGADRQFTSTEVYPYKNRAYQFRIEARTASGSYQTIVNRQSNTQTGPFIDTFSPVTARYVKITVTGCYNSSSAWATINELKVIGNP